jgi:hypothetical protein
MQVVVITAEGDVVPVAQVVGEPLPPEAAPSEITGPVFSPDGGTLLFSSQRGGDPQTGITYAVTGPFRGAGQAASTTTTTVAVAQGGAPEAASETVSSDDDSNVVPIAVGVGAVAAVAAGAVAIRRRRTT